MKEVNYENLIPGNEYYIEAKPFSIGDETISIPNSKQIGTFVEFDESTRNKIPVFTNVRSIKNKHYIGSNEKIHFFHSDNIFYDVNSTIPMNRLYKQTYNTSMDENTNTNLTDYTGNYSSNSWFGGKRRKSYRRKSYRRKSYRRKSYRRKK